MVSAEHYDPLSPEVQADPFPYYRLFQSSCPVQHYKLTEEQVARTIPEGNPFISGPVNEIWMVVGHQELRTVLQDSKTFSSLGGVSLERTIAPNGVGMLTSADEPHHAAQRAIVGNALRPRLVKQMEHRIAQYADDLIDGFISRGECDIATEYCDPLPGLMFCDLLSLPASDRPTFKKWSDDIINGYGLDPEAQRQAGVAFVELSEYFLALITERRKDAARGKELPDDLLTGLMTGEAEGRLFDDSDVVLAAQSLVLAGNDTTTGALGHGVHLLATHPDQMALLRRDPSLLPDAIEEILRYDSPAVCLFRTVTRDVTIAGVDIPAGAKVGVAYAGGNRDAAAFTNPDTFDITRSSSELRKHLTFGFGPHYCIGFALGRAQLRIGLERLLTRLPDLRLDEARPPVRQDTLITRRFGNLYLRWTPKR